MTTSTTNKILPAIRVTNSCYDAAFLQIPTTYHQNNILVRRGCWLSSVMKKNILKLKQDTSENAWARDVYSPPSSDSLNRQFCPTPSTKCFISFFSSIFFDQTCEWRQKVFSMMSNFNVGEVLLTDLTRSKSTVAQARVKFLILEGESTL